MWIIIGILFGWFGFLALCAGIDKWHTNRIERENARRYVNKVLVRRNKGE